MPLKRDAEAFTKTRSALKAPLAPSNGSPELFLVVSCETGGSIVPLAAQKQFVLGRTGECDVVIDDSSVSRKHARLTVEPTLAIEDLGSKNGTTVDGRPIPPHERVALQPGSVFELGSTFLVLHRARGTAGRLRAHSMRPPAPGWTDVDSLRPVVTDPKMKRLYTLLDVIAPSSLSVLLLGETGVGKEVIAQAIHDRSRRAGRPMLKLNCAAIPEAMLEAELFGFERGAFTGASQAKPGLFEAADGGTVFLDEVGELPPATQAKLLRVLEGGEILRLGSVKPIRVDTRFLSATNRDLRARIVEQRFRSDLFFRLSGVSVTIPPLRTRRADIVPLAELFASRAASGEGRSVPTFSAAAREALERYSWPGNVRQLKNVVERAVVMSTRDEIGASELLLEDEMTLAGEGDEAPNAPSAAPVAARSPLDRRVIHRGAAGEAVDVAEERRRILDALAEAAGNQSAAAKRLGISRHTLLSRLDEFGISRPRKRRD